MKRVSINILNYNTFEKTRECILSCLLQTGIEYRIILIDNNSTDDSLKRLKELFGNRIDYVENSDNYGYAKGNNIGVKYSLEKKYDFSLILNSDITLVGTTLLRKMYDVMNSSSEFGVVAPYIYNVTSNGLVLNSNDSIYLKWLRLSGILPSNRIKTGDICSISEAQGSAIFVDNRLFLQVGGFPEHFFMYGEEGYFAKKILWNKRSIIWYKDENDYALHHHDKSNGTDGWRLYLMGRNRALEYYENRSVAPIKWFLVFYLFWIQSFLKKDKRLYCEGMIAARKLIKKNSSKEDIYMDGKLSITRMRNN